MSVTEQSGKIEQAIVEPMVNCPKRIGRRFSDVPMHLSERREEVTQKT
jgi:hypothetical protein